MIAVFYLIVLVAMVIGTGIAIAPYVLPPIVDTVASVLRAAGSAALSVAEYVAGSPGAILLIAVAGIGGAALGVLGVRVVRAMAGQRPAGSAGHPTLVPAIAGGRLRPPTSRPEPVATGNRSSD